MEPQLNNAKPTPEPIPPWEWCILGIAMGMALMLGLSNLGLPSFWHDELIHVYVAKSIAETGLAQLPSGVPYHNGSTHNYILAFMNSAFGLTEITMRLPSVLFATLNVFLIYILTRPLLGRNTALIAAIGLALSPWAVAWSREARFYTLQQTLYLTVLIGYWHAVTPETRRAWIIGTLAALTAYTLAILTSYHSILFLGSIGGFAILIALHQRQPKSRWTLAIAIITITGLITLAGFAGLMNPLDKGAVLERGGLGGAITDAERMDRAYYFNWLRFNLSTGFFILALAGFITMLIRLGREGLYTTLAFWVPILILTFLIGYRRPRFMFFAYPVFIAAWAYALASFIEWTRNRPTTKLQWTAWAVCALFLIRAALSFIALTGDAFETAAGAHTTLARKHPQWREPCHWVRDNREPDTKILTTTFLPVHHYLGEVDNWYPTRTLWWEVDESGKDDLKTLQDLQAWLKENPRGYFISEWWRFERNRGPTLQGELHQDVIWVMENMTKLEQASNQDITVYTWGLD